MKRKEIKIKKETHAHNNPHKRHTDLHMIHIAREFFFFLLFFSFVTSKYLQKKELALTSTIQKIMI